ncbi:MAG: hypothetical protein R6U87_05005, partial [Thiohalospira sp.]
TLTSLRGSGGSRPLSARAPGWFREASPSTRIFPIPFPVFSHPFPDFFPSYAADSWCILEPGSQPFREGVTTVSGFALDPKKNDGAHSKEKTHG